jgi:hypothetical protein
VSEIKAGQIWRSDAADAFFLVAEDGGNFYVGTYRVEPHPEQGHWRPLAGKETREDTREDWLLAYARPFDRIERWAVEGARLVSIDPNRHFDLPEAP